MAVAQLKKVTVNVKLEDGTTESGAEKFVKVGLGNLDEDNYDRDKCLAIVGALEPCLSKDISSVEETKVSTLERE